MLGRIRLTAGTGQIARSVGISAVAVSLCVYGMVLQGGGKGLVVLGAVILAVSAGTILQVGWVVRQFQRKQVRMEEEAARAERHYFKVIRRLMTVVEAQEQYTRGRSRRIGFFARQIGEKLGLDQRRCGLLDLAGQVHDIGLLAVPEHILNKPGVLGASEFRTVRKHAEASCRILEPLTFLGEMLPAIRHHHERMNGTGYPAGLKGQQVPLTARILAVADAFDAMTHDRPHRPALPNIEALNELRRCSPAAYDGECVTALEEVMNLRHLREAHGVPGEVQLNEPGPAVAAAAETGAVVAVLADG